MWFYEDDILTFDKLLFKKGEPSHFIKLPNNKIGKVINCSLDDLLKICKKIKDCKVRIFHENQANYVFIDDARVKKYIGNPDYTNYYRPSEELQKEIDLFTTEAIL